MLEGKCVTNRVKEAPALRATHVRGPLQLAECPALCARGPHFVFLSSGFIPTDSLCLCFRQSKWIRVHVNSDFCSPVVGTLWAPAHRGPSLSRHCPSTAPASTEKPATETSEILSRGKRVCEERMTFGREQNSKTCRKL